MVAAWPGLMQGKYRESAAHVRNTVNHQKRNTRQILETPLLLLPPGQDVFNSWLLHHVQLSAEQKCSRQAVGTTLGVKRNPEGIGHSFKLLRRQIVVRPGLPNVPEFSTEQIIDH